MPEDLKSTTEEKDTRIQRVWRNYAPYWHICTAFIFGVYVCISWVNNVQANTDEMPLLKAKVSEQATDIAVIKNDVSETRQQVHDIWQFMRLDRTKK